MQSIGETYRRVTEIDLGHTGPLQWTSWVPGAFNSTPVKRLDLVLWANGSGSEYLAWLVLGPFKIHQIVPSDSSELLLKQRSLPGRGESVIPETRPNHPALPMNSLSLGPKSFCFSVIEVWPEITGTLWILQRVIPAYLFPSFPLQVQPLLSH